MKRILTTNITLSGSLDIDEVAKALLLHRNTLPPDLGTSPAEPLFGHPPNDHLPNPVQFRREWLEFADLREKAVNQHFTNATKHVYDRHLNPLKVGEPVAIQNQHRHHPQRWNNASTIVESLLHKQYRVLVDGSRRSALWNHCFFRKISENTHNMNLDNSVSDLNKPSDINDPPTPVIPPPESPHPVHPDQ